MTSTQTLEKQLQKMIEGKEHYPPSFELWRSIITTVKSHKIEKNTHLIQEKMMREVSKYKPSLPEPQTVRFIYENRHYFLDEKNNIYITDDNSAIVGNLIGKIEHNKVIINNKIAHELETIKVYKKTIHDKPFYIDTTNNTAYIGFQEVNKLICEIGKLEGEKIKINTTI